MPQRPTARRINPSVSRFQVFDYRQGRNPCRSPPCCRSEARIDTSQPSGEKTQFPAMRLKKKVDTVIIAIPPGFSWKEAAQCAPVELALAVEHGMRPPSVFCGFYPTTRRVAFHRSSTPFVLLYARTDPLAIQKNLSNPVRSYCNPAIPECQIVLFMAPIVFFRPVQRSAC
jgi:hypothetical protein